MTMLINFRNYTGWLLAALFLVSMSYGGALAQTFDFKTRDASVVRTAAQIKAHNGFNDTIIVRQDKWYEMASSGGSWANNLKFKSTHAFVKFYVDHAYPLKIPTAYKFRLTYRVFGYGNMADTTAFTSDIDTLTIAYDPDSLAAFQDIQFKKYSGFHKIMIVMTGLYEISGSGGTPVPVNMTTAGGATRLNFNVEGSIVTQPYHKRVLSGGSYVDVYGSAAPALNVASDAPVNDYMPVRWSLSGGSLTAPIELSPVNYELEWTYVDNYSVNPSTGAISTIAATSLSYDFANNSTRVWLDTNYYRIPLTYQKGYILYRVRMVRPDSVEYKYPVYGAWSIANASGTVSAVTAASRRQITASHLSDSMNWQYTVSFAEQGKYKHVMSYYDGMLKNRQSITRFNSTPARLIATEQVYDYEGRPSVSILPTPVTASNFRYQRNLSVNALTALPYKAADFDYISGICPLDSVPPPLSSVALANIYYSALNLDKSGFQKFVPDAGGYPFVQTIYSPGYEDRVDKQGGAGDSLQIGRKHTVKNDYVGADQMDLNRAFGLNIGWSGFYRKTVSKDPNGQFSMNVTDYKGKTVASSMIGIPDTVSQALVANENLPDTAGFKEDFIAGTEQSVAGNRIILDKTYFNDAAANNTAQYIYNFTPYPTFCPGTYLSVKSAFDYSIFDECGTQEGADSGVLGTTGAVFSGSLVSYTAPVRTFFLTQGRHSVHKELTINMDEVDNAVDSFLALTKAKNCLKTEREFIREAVESKDYPCENDDYGCDMLRRVAIEELYPNLDSADVTRKYGYYSASGASNNNSIFSLIAGGNGKRRYQSDCIVYPDTVWYEGTPYTNIKDLSYDVFAMIFNDTIAEALLPLHPEYCLMNCYNDPYEQRLRDIPDAPTATALNLFTPANLATSDPIYAEMLAAPSLFPSPVDTLTRMSGQSLHNKALAMAYCDCGDSVLYDDCTSRIYNSSIAASLLTDPYVRERYFLILRDLYTGNRLRYRYLLAPETEAVDCSLCQPVRMTLTGAPVFVTTTGGSTGFGSLGAWADGTSAGSSAIMGDYLDLIDDPDYGPAVDSAMDLYASGTSALCAGAVEGIINALVNCADSVSLLKVRDTLLAICARGQVAYGQYSPDQVRYALTKNGIAIGDLCNVYLVNYDYTSPTMTMNQGGFMCGSPAFFNDTKTTLNGAALNALKTLGTEYTATFSAANQFQNKVITAIGGTAVRMKASQNATTKLYTLKLYRTGGPDTVRVNFRSEATGDCGNIFSTAGGATVTIAAVHCTKDVFYGFPNGLVGANTFGVTVTRTIGSATTNCTLPAWTEKMTMNPAGKNNLAECVPCTQMRTLYKEFWDTCAVLQVKGADHPYYSTMLRNFMNFRLRSSYATGQYLDAVEGCALADSMQIKRYIGYANFVFNSSAGADSFLRAMNLINPDIAIIPAVRHTAPSSAVRVLIDFRSIPVNKLKVYKDAMAAFTYNVSSKTLDSLYFNSATAMGVIYVPASVSFTPVPATIFGSAPYPFTFNTSSGYTVNLGSDPAVSCKYIAVTAPAGATDASKSANIYTLQKYLQDNGIPGTYIYPLEPTINPEYNLADKKEYLKYVYKYQANPPSSVLDSLQEPFLLSRIAAYAGHTLSYGHPANPAGIKNLYIGDNATATTGTQFAKVSYILDKVKAYLPGDAIFFTGANTRSILSTSTESLVAYRCGDTAFWYRYFGPDDTLYNIFVRVPRYIDTADYPDYNLTTVSYNLGEGQSRSVKLTLTNPAMPSLPLKLDAFTDFTVANNTVLHNVLLAWPILSEEPKPDTVLNCERQKLNAAIYEGKVRYRIYIDSVREQLRNDFYAYLMGGGIKEKLLVGYKTQRFNYTLYYYDRAGNLMRTVPPAGVTMLSTSLLPNVDVNRASDTYSSSLVNFHTKSSSYIYNTLNQVEEQTTPDGGRTEYFYDAAGRVIFSQNEKQRPNGYMSYTLYDPQGRIMETGQAKITCTYFAPIPIGTFPDMTPFIGCTYISSDGTLTPFPEIVNNLKNHTHQEVIDYVRSLTREEVVFTHYDTAALNLATATGMSQQENLRKRVSCIKYFDYLQPTNTTFVRYTYAMHFSYDIAGNVKTLTRDYPALRTHNQQFKRIDYDYDVISGKVNLLSYNRGFADQYYQRYSYDDDNRITGVATSADGYIWDRDAAYEYYQHGPLGRMSLGDRRVQGVDYAYTIQGWLKAVNGDLLDTAKDMGADGKMSSVHAQDAVALTLDYFKGDYKPIGTTAVTNIAAPGKSLYNGNIPRANTAIVPFQNLNARYTYDQLNRIVRADYANTSPTATLTNTADYYSSYAYDPDGNLKKLVRNGNKPATQQMDSMVYKINSANNQLTNIVDYVNDNYPNDIRKYTTTTATRYRYDATGNAIKDLVSGLDTIRWNHYNKTVGTRTDTAGKELRFSYDGAGNRYWKGETRIKADTVTEDITYYVRDAQGNILATYDIDTRSEKPKQVWVNNITSDILSATSTTTYITDLIGPAFAIDGNFKAYILSKMALSTTWMNAKLNATPVSIFIKASTAIKANTFNTNTSYAPFLSAFSAWTRATHQPVLATGLYYLFLPEGGGGQQLAPFMTYMINNAGTQQMKKHVAELLCGSDDLLRATIQSMGYPYRPDSSCTFNMAPLVNGQPNWTQFYATIQQLGLTQFGDDYWSFMKRLGEDSLIMNFSPYTSPASTIAPYLTAGVVYGSDSLLGVFMDSWSPSRQLMQQGNTNAALLATLYELDPGALISGYTTGVTGGLDTVKKSLAAIPWLTASDYLTAASSFLTGYVVGPAVLANTLRYHKFALGAHHIYGSGRLGTKDYLPGQYYRTRDYTGPSPVFDTLALTMREPWYSLEYNDAISSLSLSPYGNTQKGKYFLRRLIGMKQYELTNHLGNVQATVTDYPVAVIKGTQGNTIGFRRPALATAYDYYPFGMLMPGRYVSDTTSKCVTITQTKWTQNWNIKIYAYADWVWPGLTLAGGATATASQIVTTTMPVNGSVSFTFEAAPTLENQAQLNIASLSGKPRISIYETLATGTEVELTSIMPQAAGTFNLTYTPSTSSIKVKILGTGTTTSSINWGNVQIWKPEMVQTDVLVDICEKDNDRYMYGFNGQIKDNEWAGIGNYMEFLFRGNDTRIGRFLSIDPLSAKYPWNSVYAFAENRPIDGRDLEGKEWTSAQNVGGTQNVVVNMNVTTDENAKSDFSQHALEDFQGKLSAKFNEVLSKSSNGTMTGKVTFNPTDRTDVMVPSINFYKAKLQPNAPGSIGGATYFGDITMPINNTKTGEIRTSEDLVDDAVHELMHTLRIWHPFEIYQTKDTELKIDQSRKNSYRTTNNTDKNIIFNLMIYPSTIIDGQRAGDVWRNQRPALLTAGQIKLMLNEIKLQESGAGSQDFLQSDSEGYNRFWGDFRPGEETVKDRK